MQPKPFLRPSPTLPAPQPRAHTRLRLTVLLLTLLGGLCAPLQTNAQTPSATTLTLTAAGTPSTTIPAATITTLTAAVTASGTPLTRGQVNFCDASAPTCADIHLLGTAQLTPAGTATLRFRPAIGTHTYRAIFLGTQTYATSTSATTPLTVTGLFPSSTTLTSTTSTDLYTNYTLTATVAATFYGPNPPTLTGPIPLYDATNNTTLATPTLGPTTTSITSTSLATNLPANTPISAVPADLNGDGIPDLAVLNASTTPSSLAILLGNGDGTFTAVPNPSITVSISSVAVGDFNSDGIPDLALSLNNSNALRILLGNGDGTFTPKSPDIAVPNNPSQLTVADFNHDGIPDLVLLTGTDARLLLGQGDGTFTTPTILQTTNYGFRSVTAADLNHDGIPDLVLTSLGGTLTILLGNGTGTFTASSDPNVLGDSDVTSFPVLAIADFNADGTPDLAAASYLSSSSFSILLGKGDGTFSPPRPASPTSGTIEILIAADFNGDGKADLAVFGGGQIPYIVLGKGDGSFGDPNSILPRPLGGVATADFNGDGIPDLAEPGSGPQNSIAINLLNSTLNASATATGITPQGPGPHQVTATFAATPQNSGSQSTPLSLPVQVATPVISPASGPYSSQQTLTITDSTPGATITYSILNGGTEINNQPYTGPVLLSTAGTDYIAATASAPGYQSSVSPQTVLILSYPAAPAPVFSLPAGTYAGPQTVTITDATPNATIYYTLNGAPPNELSPIYTGPITIAASEVLTAVASAPNASFGPPTAAQYLLSSAPAPFIYTIAGSHHYGYSGDGGPATQANLNAPLAAVQDAAGNLFIADTNNFVVRKVAAGTGTITTYAGNGTAGYTGDGGPATAAQLASPVALAVNAAGDLFIADYMKGVVRKVAAASGVITTFAGPGNSTSNGDGGPAAAAQIDSPSALAFDAAGNLYVATSLSIRKIATGTGTISTVAGTLAPGNTGDGGIATAATISPTGLAIDAAGNLYISSQRYNNVQKVNAQTGFISTIAGLPRQYGYKGDGGPSTSAVLYDPYSLAIDTAGNLLIADSYNQAIRAINLSTGIITTIAGAGPGAICGDAGGDASVAAGAALCYPRGVAVNGAGDILIADTESSRIRIVKASSVLPSAATATPVFSLASGTYGAPQTLTITDSTPGASIYVTLNSGTPSTSVQAYNGPIPITANTTVQAIAGAPGYLPSTSASINLQLSLTPTTIISTVAGTGVSGFDDAGTPASAARVSNPTALVSDAAGNIYFTEANQNFVRKFSASTGKLTIVAGNGVRGSQGDGGPATLANLKSPTALALDAAGNLYISDQETSVVREVDAKSGIISLVAGNYYFGTGNQGNGGLATNAPLSTPSALAFDSAGNLYIAEQFAGDVRMVAAQTGIITTFAGKSNASGDTGDGGLATNAGLLQPLSITFDAAGNCYIATAVGHIRKIAAGTGIITTIAGNGAQGGASGDGGQALAAEITPQSLAVDPSGNLLFSDDASGTIRKINLTSGLITSIIGTGYQDFGGDGGDATMADLKGPAGIAFDAAGNLYIADYGNNRIRKVSFTQPTPAPTFTPAAGTYTTPQTITLADPLPAAVIHYTTDGSTPTATSPTYTAPIPATQTTTLQAIAISPGYVASNVVTATFTIQLPAATPTFSLASGTYTSPQTVTLADTTPGAVIHYTTDGSAPTSASPVYNSPLTVTQTETISAIATANGFSQSLSVSLTLTIQAPLQPPIQITPSQTAITVLQPLTVSLFLSPVAPRSTPTGSISLSGGGFTAQATLASGTASFTLPPGALAAGKDVLTASYTPDSTSTSAYLPTQATTTVNVAPLGAATASLAVTPTTQTVTDSQKITLNVTLTGTATAPIPTGVLSLRNGNTPILQQILTNGAATLTIPSNTLPAGSSTLSVTYSGDTTYSPASTTTTVTVSALILSTTTPTPVSPGSSTTATITLTAGSTVSGNLNLTCTLTSAPTNAQHLPTCAVTPSVLSVSAAGTGTASITFTTQAPQTAAIQKPLHPRRRLAGEGGIAFATLIFCASLRRRRLPLLLLCLLCLSLAQLTGCGSGNPGPITPTNPTNPGTTTGSYTFTVTAASAASPAVTAATQLTLSVN